MGSGRRFPWGTVSRPPAVRLPAPSSRALGAGCGQGTDWVKRPPALTQPDSSRARTLPDISGTSVAFSAASELAADKIGSSDLL